MVAASHFGIDYPVITDSTLINKIEPVKTFAGPPPDDFQQQAHGFAGQFNGINSLVCKCLPPGADACRRWLIVATDSWGGALLFIAFLAEMRHPWDFWKGMLAAQVFIGAVYIFFGAFVRHFVSGVVPESC